MIWGFPDGSDDKGSACNAGDPDSIPGSGRSPGEGLQSIESQRIRHNWSDLAYRNDLGNYDVALLVDNCTILLLAFVFYFQNPI